ncbi:MAG: hypothetical protein EPN21_17925 [Methylococcaceae bacterium]|nr:MAG: hypothetical protein EPN21_17925 [Methylococcaceae bacterium]
MTVEWAVLPAGVFHGLKSHNVLHPLLEPSRFAAATLGEWGFDVTWDNGGDLSIAATALRRLAEEQASGPAI